MESAIAPFCKNLATFCNNIESSTRDLSDSIQRRPIPLDSAACAFMQSLDRRISSVSTDLNLLESMALGTVSFEELLGHCNEVYKTNQKYIEDVEDRMKSFGYVPELEDGDRDGLGLDSEFSSPKIEAKVLDFTCGSVSVVKSNRKKLEDDLLFEDSLSLQNLGLSDACLATLASDNDYPACPILSSQDAISQEDSQLPNSAASFQLPIVPSTESDGGATKTNAMIKISKDDYDTLPSYMKSLASWEELQGAVIKLNDYLSKKEGAEECSAIDQQELETLALGHKGRSYLLLLLRMKQLVVENVDGSIQYRTCASES